jgi:hypothetical protein
VNVPGTDKNKIGAHTDMCIALRVKEDFVTLFTILKGKSRGREYITF